MLLEFSSRYGHTQVVEMSKDIVYFHIRIITSFNLMISYSENLRQTSAQWYNYDGWTMCTHMNLHSRRPQTTPMASCYTSHSYHTHCSMHTSLNSQVTLRKCEVLLWLNKLSHVFNVGTSDTNFFLYSRPTTMFRMALIGQLQKQNIIYDVHKLFNTRYDTGYHRCLEKKHMYA
jgi:hypothetical protein